MFDTTVFNRIAHHLGEIAKELKRANDMKQAEQQKLSIPKRMHGPYVGTPYVGTPQTTDAPTQWPYQTQFTANTRPINPPQTEY